jgi:DNA sulfur modification protein DndE
MKKNLLEGNLTMIPPIETIKISKRGRNQLSQIRRQAGIENLNVICRWAFCVSLREKTRPTVIAQKFDGGIEISWKVFAGNQSEIFNALIIIRARKDGFPLNPEGIAYCLISHIHRGLFLLASGKESKSLSDFTKRLLNLDIKELINSELFMPDISIVVAALGETEFKEMADFPHCGILRIPVSSELKIIHGFNLVAAIIMAKLHSSKLIQETIPVLIIPTQGSERLSTIQENLSRKTFETQQTMSAKRVKKRILHEKVKDLLSLSPFLQMAVARGKSSIAPRSRYLLTHSCLAMACSPMFSSFDQHDLTNQMALVAEYWQYLSQILNPWRDFFDGKISANEVRQKTILNATTAVEALGKLGAQVIITHPISWKKNLMPLKEINWNRNFSSIWEGVAFRNGVLLKGESAKEITYNILKQIVAAQHLRL